MQFLCDADGLPAFSLREACPALEDILWNVDIRIMVDLETSLPPDGDEHGMTMIDQYAQELFHSPALERFAIQGVSLRGKPVRKNGKVHGTVFRRTEDGAVKGPDNEPSKMVLWNTLYSGLVSLAGRCMDKC